MSEGPPFPPPSDVTCPKTLNTGLRFVWWCSEYPTRSYLFPKTARRGVRGTDTLPSLLSKLGSPYNPPKVCKYHRGPRFVNELVLLGDPTTKVVTLISYPTYPLPPLPFPSAGSTDGSTLIVVVPTSLEEVGEGRVPPFVSETSTT